MSRKQRYGQFSGVYGALAALVAYTLVQAGVIPKQDIPFIVEAGSAVEIPETTDSVAWGAGLTAFAVVGALLAFVKARYAGRKQERVE